MTWHQTIQYKPLWAEPLVTCTQVTSRLHPDSAHIHRTLLTQAALAKFFSPGQVRPVQGFAAKPGCVFGWHREGHAESGLAPRDPSVSPQKVASLPRVNVILRYYTSALQLQIGAAGSNLLNRKELIKYILSLICKRVRRQYNYCNYVRYLLQSYHLCWEFYLLAMAEALKKTRTPASIFTPQVTCSEAAAWLFSLQAMELIRCIIVLGMIRG